MRDSRNNDGRSCVTRGYGGGMRRVEARAGLTSLVTTLQPRNSRANAQRFDFVRCRSSDDEGWRICEWRLKAVGVSTSAALEGWYGPADAAEPVIGRIRTKRCPPGVEAEFGDLGALIGGSSTEHGVTEILNLELEPLFFGQQLGVGLIRNAISGLPSDDIVACEPIPTEFLNVRAEDSLGAVRAFYRKLGLRADQRVPRYLIATRADLILD